MYNVTLVDVLTGSLILGKAIGSVNFPEVLTREAGDFLGFFRKGKEDHISSSANNE